MALLPLHPFPQQPAPTAAITAHAHLDADGLLLTYRLTADLSQLILPARQPAQAADGLWQHSCFEAFVAAQDGPAYREFNFSPSGQWAAYDFSDYRQRNLAFAAVVAPVLSLRPLPDGLELSAHLAPQLLPQASRLILGLTAVIEQNDGQLSYWSLHHPGPRPDFHLRTGWTAAVALS